MDIDDKVHQLAVGLEGRGRVCDLSVIVWTWAEVSTGDGRQIQLHPRYPGLAGPQAIFTSVHFPIFPRLSLVNACFTCIQERKSYLKRKKKKTALLYSILLSVLTMQDGKIPGHTARASPLTLDGPSAKKLLTVFSRDQRKQAGPGRRLY